MKELKELHDSYKELIEIFYKEKNTIWLNKYAPNAIYHTNKDGVLTIEDSFSDFMNWYDLTRYSH